MDIITRKEAKEQGLKHYFTGKPCKHGHVVERYVSSKKCKKCSSEYNRTSEKAKTRNKKWRQDNPEKMKERYHRRYIREKEKRKEYACLWRQGNPEKVVQYSHRYLQRKNEAIPKWYETDLVKQLYLKRDELSRLWGISLDVDHIVPLQGNDVCGLHCWDNLQLLESSLNKSKSNKFKD